MNSYHLPGNTSGHTDPDIILGGLEQVEDQDYPREPEQPADQPEVEYDDPSIEQPPELVVAALGQQAAHGMYEGNGVVAEQPIGGDSPEIEEPAVMSQTAEVKSQSGEGLTDEKEKKPNEVSQAAAEVHAHDIEAEGPIEEELREDPVTDAGLIPQSAGTQPSSTTGGRGGQPPEPPGNPKGGEPNDEEGAQLRAEMALYVKRYTTTELEVGKPIMVPTVTGPMPFIRANRDWGTGADIDRYRLACFGDQYEFQDQPEATTRYRGRAVLRSDQSEVVAGGESEAFARGKTVLDVGSGQALTIEQASLENPNTTFWGIDTHYGEARPLVPGVSGVQLTRSNWDTLEGVPDGSVDTIIAYSSSFFWAEDDQHLDALTRVAADGATLRFNASELVIIDNEDPEDKLEQVLEGLIRRGWEIIMSETHNTVIGIKTTSRAHEEIR